MGFFQREAPGLDTVQADESDDLPVCMDPNDRRGPNILGFLRHRPIWLQARVLDHYRITGDDQTTPELREREPHTNHRIGISPRTHNFGVVFFDQQHRPDGVGHNPSRPIQDEIQHIFQLQRAAQSSRNITKRLSQLPLLSAVVTFLRTER